MQQPETHYVDADGVQLAYQAWGTGDVVVVGVTNWATSVEGMWQVDGWVDFAQRLTRSVQLVIYDQRGSGLSDRVSATVDTETTVRDLLAIVDHVGVGQVALMATDLSTPTALAFAATHPERVSRIVLLAPTARLTATDDYLVGYPPEIVPRATESIVEGWGVVDSLFNLLATPDSYPGAPADRAQVARVQRQAVSRRDLPAIVQQALENDARPYLDRVRAPVLILHRADDRFVLSSHGRWLAEHLTDVRYVEIPGDGHFLWLGSDRQRAEVARLSVDFVLGDSGARIEAGRLTAIVVTDVVESTTTAAAMGPEAWRHLLDRHDDIVRRQLRLRAGTEWSTAGDSFLLTFDSVHAAARFAVAVADLVQPLGIDIRAGIHLADVEERAGTVHGFGIHVAARVQGVAKPGQVVVTAGVRDALAGDDDFIVEPLGNHELRGVPGSWSLASVTGPP